MNPNPSPFALAYQLRNHRQLFNKQTVRQLPMKRVGIYAIWIPTENADLPDCIYVGESTDCIRARLLQHLSNETNPKLRHLLHIFSGIAEFSFSYTHGRSQTKNLETEMIHQLHPETNRNKLAR